MQTEALISLALYFILMMAIGYYAYRKSTSNVAEYMLGGRQLHPAVAALSAGASDMSGWMLMGLPGAIYVSGMSSAWIAVGLLIGAYLNYKLVAPPATRYLLAGHRHLLHPLHLGRCRGWRQAVRGLFRAEL